MRVCAAIKITKSHPIAMGQERKGKKGEMQIHVQGSTNLYSEVCAGVELKFCIRIYIYTFLVVLFPSSYRGKVQESQQQ